MKALVRFDTKPETLQFQEVPTPTPDETHAILRVEAVGICGRDLEHFRDRRKILLTPAVDARSTCKSRLINTQ